MTTLRRHHIAITLLMALALMVRAAVPSGWMPVAQDGSIRIALCTGEGAVMAVLGPDGRIHKSTPEEPRDPCPFGMASGQSLALADAPLLPNAGLVATAAPTPVLVTAARQIRRSLRPPVRGPPAFA